MQEYSRVVSFRCAPHHAATIEALMVGFDINSTTELFRWLLERPEVSQLAEVGVRRLIQGD